MGTANSDQTGRMPRLIWVFAGSTCHFVGFVMIWLIVVFIYYIPQEFPGPNTEACHIKLKWSGHNVSHQGLTPLTNDTV